MAPLVYRTPLATALFYGVFVTWAVFELRIMVRNRGGTGEDLDRGGRVWVVLLIAVGMGAAFGLGRADVGHLGGWAPLTAGLVVALGGIALRQWSVATLGSFFTTAVEVQHDHRIIDSGPYTWIRHPAYTGTLLTIVGLSLALGNWLGCLIAASFSAAGLVQRILVEERALASRLGPSWTSFARGRKRLVPLVW